MIMLDILLLLAFYYYYFSWDYGSYSSVLPTVTITGYICRLPSAIKARKLHHLHACMYKGRSLAYIHIPTTSCWLVIVVIIRAYMCICEMVRTLVSITHPRNNTRTAAAVVCFVYVRGVFFPKEKKKLTALCFCVWWWSSIDTHTYIYSTLARRRVKELFWT